VYVPVLPQSIYNDIQTFPAKNIKKNFGKIPMGIVDTTNTSRSTQKVLKCKEAMFLCYYKYMHVKIIRTNSILNLKYLKKSHVQEIDHFQLIHGSARPNLLWIW
jgi:hypothetical protein